MCKLIDFIAVACDGKFSLTYFLKFSFKPDDSDLSGDRADRELCMARSLSACDREWKVLDLWDFMVFMSIPHTVKGIEFQDIPGGRSRKIEFFSGVSS